jgi:hypothetical protein
MGVNQVCSNKSPWFKFGLGPGEYIQVRVILLYLSHTKNKDRLK